MITPIKTKSGVKYLARVYVKGARPSKIFEARGDAEKWVNSIRYRRDRGCELISQPVTVQQLFDSYMVYAEEKGRSHSTLRTHRFNFKNWLLRFYGSADLTTVTLEEHRALGYFLKKENVSAATRNRIRALIKVMYSTAIRGQLFNAAFKSNPFDSIEPVVETKEPVKYLTQDEVEALLRGNEETHYYPLLLLILRTGLRIGEALGLHHEQVDLKTGMLVIDRQFDKSQNRIIKRTKSKKVRVVYLLEDVLRNLPEVKKGPIFLKEDGSTITSDYFLKFILPKACQRSGVKLIHPHGLRHSFAANYLMCGGNIWDLSKILGHHSVSVTERYYAHFTLEHVKNRMRVLEKQGNLIRASFGEDPSIKPVNKIA